MVSEVLTVLNNLNDLVTGAPLRAIETRTAIAVCLNKLRVYVTAMSLNGPSPKELKLINRVVDLVESMEKLTLGC